MKKGVTPLIDKKVCQTSIKERKVKKRFSDDKSILLHNWIDQNPDFKINLVTKQLLSALTGLTVKQVSDWLKNEKNKSKKEDTPSNRIIFSQRMILKSHFIYANSRPNVNEVQILMKKTGLTEKKIMAWFTKQRHKLNNDSFNIFN